MEAWAAVSTFFPLFAFPSRTRSHRSRRGQSAGDYYYSPSRGVDVGRPDPARIPNCDPWKAPVPLFAASSSSDGAPSPCLQLNELQPHPGSEVLGATYLPSGFRGATETRFPAHSCACCGSLFHIRLASIVKELYNHCSPLTFCGWTTESVLVESCHGDGYGMIY